MSSYLFAILAISVLMVMVLICIIPDLWRS